MWPQDTKKARSCKGELARCGLHLGAKDEIGPPLPFDADLSPVCLITSGDYSKLVAAPDFEVSHFSYASGLSITRKP